MEFMAFEIRVTRSFSAAHQLRLAGNALEPLHGHNWTVRATVGSASLDALGTVMDFHELQRLLDALVMPLHNRHLNELSPFAEELNPSAENVALHIGRSLKLPRGVQLLAVEVWETPDCSAIYRPDAPVM
jgi:6-pyruvoyltetrahydropterin/6-carboxytetrahydropterin synthase